MSVEPRQRTPEERTADQLGSYRRAAPLPKAPNGARKSLIPVKVKRFDSADYFLTKHLEKQRAAQRQEPLFPAASEDEVTGCSSRPPTSESDRTDTEDSASLPPSLSQKRYGTAATGAEPSSWFHQHAPSKG